VAEESTAITNHDRKGVNGGGGKNEELRDPSLHEIMGTPTIH